MIRYIPLSATGTGIRSEAKFGETTKKSRHDIHIHVLVLSRVVLKKSAENPGYCELKGQTGREDNLFFKTLKTSIIYQGAKKYLSENLFTNYKINLI
jgi:hypothetical protein